MLPPSLQKSKERLEKAMLAEPMSPSSSIERIFAFLHAKALEDSAEASGTPSEAAKRREVDLLLEVIAETATELEKEKSRTGQLRRRLSELEENQEKEEKQRLDAEVEQLDNKLKKEADHRDLILRERNLSKALAQARADMETLSLWKTQEAKIQQKSDTALLPSPKKPAQTQDAISEAAEQRSRRMQQERLRSVMSKYYYV